MSDWVVLPTTRGPIVTCRDAISHIAAPTYDPIPFEETGVEVTLISGPEYRITPSPGESPADALARVCALLGIEVTR